MKVITLRFKVSISIVHEYVPNARRVFVKPASENDWEVIELNAGYVEQNLLSQVAVVASGQPIFMQVHQTRIQLIVGMKQRKY